VGQTITLELGEEAYQSLERVASAAHADVRAVLLNMVERMVYPLASSSVFSEMALLSDSELRDAARKSFPRAQLRAFDRLRREQEDGPLAPEEQQRLDTLRSAYQEAEVRKACALAILHLRRQLDTKG